MCYFARGGLRIVARLLMRIRITSIIAMSIRPPRVLSWQSDERFANFWKHYYLAQSWPSVHRLLLTGRCITSSHESPFLKRIQNQSSSEVSTEDEFVISNSDTDVRCLTSLRDQCDDQCEKPSTSFSNAESHEDEELSEEMVKFFRQTIEHRKERDANRYKTGEKSAGYDHWLPSECDEYILAEDIGVEGIKRRTLDDPHTREDGEKKKRDMQALYGQDAEKIAAMETLIQLNFDIHSSNAQLWPSIPLKL
ncbi:hypothetical protein AB6A40_001462 [Gnathostoma spinigerum]|uniref:Uncharacterized protein n=1 Tax=Gnathostoma spinigerum TaxID=75299 RepID=A0ABD6E475_9BILA